VLASAEDLEHQLVGLIAVLAEQDVDALERRRLQRLEAVAGEDRAQHAERRLAFLVVGGEEVARA
jgi:hypothetical protein